MILNYTTTISVQKTAGEIQEILGRAGARSVLIEYGEDRTPVALSFIIMVNGKAVSFRLPSRWRGVYKTIEGSEAPRKLKTEDQAQRVAWRIIKDWTEAQIALVEAGAAEVSEVFLPYLVSPRTGQTLFEDFKSGYLLGDGK